MAKVRLYCSPRSVPETIGNRAQRIRCAVAPHARECCTDLEPEVAERLVKERFLEYEQLMMQQPWLRALRDDR